jgi:hypothetical protein
MSPKNSLLTAGLTALGLFGYAPLGVADPTPPTPSGNPASVAPNPSHAVLLLTNGRLLEGVLSESDDTYFVHTKTGKMPMPKQRVEKVGRNIREIYEYMRERLPERDPDEQMRLAQWCLPRGMKTEAVEHLNQVLALSPNHPHAQAMLDQIAGAEERALRRDPDVTQARAEVVEDHPDGLDAATVGRAQRALGISTLPQIPGLPKAMAVKRAGEFARFVDPLLQQRCAKCHDEQYDGTFQLIRYKTRGDHTAEARNTNLDAVLALIDMENPAKSELLSSTLRVHGKGNHARPIFRGANDPEYKILATWVGRLRMTPTTEVAAQPSRFGASPPASSEGDTFAAARNRSVPLPPLSPTPGPAPAPRPAGQLDPAVPASMPPAMAPPSNAAENNNPISPPDLVDSGVIPSNVRVTKHEGTMQHPTVPPGSAFPTPFSVTGVPPKANAAPEAALPPLPSPGAAPGVPAGAGVGTVPGAVPVAAPARAPAPAAAPVAQGLPPADDLPPAAAATGTSRKPLKIDPAKLEKALMNRYAPQ